MSLLNKVDRLGFFRYVISNSRIEMCRHHNWNRRFQKRLFSDLHTNSQVNPSRYTSTINSKCQCQCQRFASHSSSANPNLSPIKDKVVQKQSLSSKPTRPPGPGDLKSGLRNVLTLNADEALPKKSKLFEEIQSDWITVYRFAYIRFGRVVQRLKLFQTAFTCLLVLPGSFGCFLYGLIPFDYCVYTGFTSGLAATMLYVMGTFCSRLIGVIYVSKSDPNLVRVAHLNFWGRREDKILAKNDFIPFSELPDNVSDIYINVKFYSELESKLHLCLRYGTVYDKEEFEDIFGRHGSLVIRDVDNKNKSSRKL